MSKAVKCKVCGLDGLEWVRDQGKWRLYTPNGTFHLCVMTDEQVDKWKIQKEASIAVCKHLVPKSDYCAECTREEADLQEIERNTGHFRR